MTILMVLEVDAIFNSQYKTNVGSIQSLGNMSKFDSVKFDYICIV